MIKNKQKDKQHSLISYRKILEVNKNIPNEYNGLYKFIQKHSVHYMLGYKEKNYHIYCTQCEKWHTSENKHVFGKEYKCPNCKTKGQYKSYKRVKHLDSYDYFSTIHTLDDMVLIRTYRIEKRYKENHLLFNVYEILRDYITNDGRFQLRKGYSRNMMGDIYIYHDYSQRNWQKQRFAYYQGNTLDISSVLFKANLKGTLYQYWNIKQYAKYYDKCWADMLDNYDYSFEMLTKMKLYHLVESRPNYKLLNKYYSEIKKHKLTPREISFLPYCDYKVAMYWALQGVRANDIANKFDLTKLYNYLTKQNATYSYYEDYIDFLLELGISLRKHKYPRDLKQAHDKYSNMLDLERNKQYDKDIQTRSITLSNLIDFTKGLIVKPIDNVEELVNEGKQLIHCVGNYAKRYSEGQTDIYAIRQLNNPYKPFVTLEIKDNEVRQCYGYDNKEPEEYIINFAEQFMELNYR